MGLWSDYFYFYDLPNIEIIKDKIIDYSGLEVVLIRLPERELDFEFEHKSSEMEICVEISIVINEPISTINISCLADKIDKEYYLYRLIGAVLVDLGGLNKDMLLIPAWAREKWQGQKWLKKAMRSPYFWDRIIGKING